MPGVQLKDEPAIRACLSFRRLLLVGVLMMCAFGALFHRFLFENNFDVVDPGFVYRSAQPKGELEELLRRYRIASVLNLRGGTEADSWYVDEVRATRELDFYDLPMSAERRPTRAELIRLLDLFDTCAYPLLIHCKSGSDRTGLASGLYLMSRRDQLPRRAVRAFSIWHGHIPIRGPERLHEPFVEYDAWLAARGLVHTSGRLRDWVEHEYRASDFGREVEPPQPGPRALRLSHASRR
jgi:hypothetical protein